MGGHRSWLPPGDRDQRRWQRLTGVEHSGYRGRGTTSVWSAADATANGMTLTNGGLTVRLNSGSWDVAVDTRDDQSFIG